MCVLHALARRVCNMTLVRRCSSACVCLRVCFVRQPSLWKTLGSSNKILIGPGGRHLLISYGKAGIGKRTHKAVNTERLKVPYYVKIHFTDAL